MNAMKNLIVVLVVLFGFGVSEVFADTVYPGYDPSDGDYMVDGIGDLCPRGVGGASSDSYEGYVYDLSSQGVLEDVHILLVAWISQIEIVGGGSNNYDLSWLLGNNFWGGFINAEGTYSGISSGETLADYPESLVQVLCVSHSLWESYQFGYVDASSNSWVYPDPNAYDGIWMFEVSGAEVEMDAFMIGNGAMNVSVPEPATASLLFLGATLLVRRRRR